MIPCEDGKCSRMGNKAFFRCDLTEQKVFSLSKASKELVHNLQEPLSVNVFFSSDLPAPYNSVEQYLRDILIEYKNAGNKNFTYKFYDMNKDLFNKPLQLPGKAFNFTMTGDFIYASTWNGFLLKISRTTNNIVWSRKVYSMPFHVVKINRSLQLCNLDGELMRLNDDNGQTIDYSTNKVQVNITAMDGIDSTLVLVSSTNKLFLQNTKRKDFSPTQVLMENPIVSMQVFRDQNEDKIIISLSDQSILLYSSIGTPLWKFPGKKSIFSKPFIYDGKAWIDQGNEIIAQHAQRSRNPVYPEPHIV